MAFLYLPIALVVIFSFNNSRVGTEWTGFTAAWYGQIWGNEQLMRALWNSLQIATATTLISCLLGTLAAWLLYRYRFPAQRMILGLVFFPMIVPEIIMGVSFLLLFALAGVERGFLTVIIAHVTFCFPFVMIAVGARLQGLDLSLEEAAMDLGATPLQAFLRVIVPYLMPSVIAGGLMAFTLSIDEFVVTWFTYDAGSVTLPVEIYGAVKRGLDPTINALSTLLVVSTVVLLLAAAMARRLSSGKPNSAGSDAMGIK